MLPLLGQYHLALEKYVVATGLVQLNWLSLLNFKSSLVELVQSFESLHMKVDSPLSQQNLTFFAYQSSSYVREVLAFFSRTS